MTRFEYALVELAEPIMKRACKILDDYGRDGWEAYAAVRHEEPAKAPATGARAWTTFYMKRAVQLESAAEEKPK